MTVDVYLGIDPGATGALAASWGHRITVIDYEDDPLEALKVWVDPIYRFSVLATIEKQQAMKRQGRKQGVSSTFKLGLNYGKWLGALEALDIPYQVTAPRKWQKWAFEGMEQVWEVVKGKKSLDTKTMSRERAWHLFPSMQSCLTRAKDHGRSDALLIMEYGKQLDYRRSAERLLDLRGGK